MKLAREHTTGGVRAIVTAADGLRRDVRPLTEDISADSLGRPLTKGEVSALPVIGEPTEYDPPVASVGQVVCIGLKPSRAGLTWTATESLR